MCRFFQAGSIGNTGGGRENSLPNVNAWLNGGVDGAASSSSAGFLCGADLNFNLRNERFVVFVGRSKTQRYTAVGPLTLATLNIRLRETTKAELLPPPRGLGSPPPGNLRPVS